MATSFEGKHGSIRYWLKAEIDKPWSFNTKVKKCFTVISPIDINIPEYMVRESEREREREIERDREIEREKSNYELVGHKSVFIYMGIQASLIQEN